ncbi:3D domain-containing protein [Clostridium polynesiense]|uniref:3D domain-containing protein n=1 Tax=Clostridium polynesiense TaxID=1325933 RepID=UPI00058E8580|nr:3D domain-containing protein [Clostridium polynesiense]
MEKLKKYFNKHFSNGPKATFIITLIAASLVLFVFNMRKTIAVNIDGEEKTIVTYKRTVAGALQDNGIILGPLDKVHPGIDALIRDINEVVIERAVNISVEVDGKNLKILTNEDSLKESLEKEGISLKEEDRVQPTLSTKPEEGMNVVITRVNTEFIKTIAAIDYTTEVKKDNELEKGKSKVLQEGVPGEKEITTKVVYENGREVSRDMVEEKTIKTPVNKVVSEGAMVAVVASRGGVPSNVNISNTSLGKKVITVKATAYWAGDDGGTVTATGTVPVRVPSGWSTIAVDPRVIPLGTKVFVEGYGYAIAQDTGGAIKGNRIDVFLSNASQVYSWGVRTVNVHILGK